MVSLFNYLLDLIDVQKTKVFDYTVIFGLDLDNHGFPVN